MARDDKRWDVGGYHRPLLDQLPDGRWWPDADRQQPVVVVTDNATGWVYEVVVHAGRIEELNVRPPTGALLTQRAMSGVPLGYLRDLATSYWPAIEAMTADLSDAANLTAVEDAIRASLVWDTPVVGKPTPEDFASTWKATPARRFDAARQVWVSRREALTEIYRRPNGSKVSLVTIDSWTREARDLGLVDAAKTGKPRTKTPGDTPSPVNERKKK